MRDHEDQDQLGLVNTADAIDPDAEDPDATEVPEDAEDYTLPSAEGTEPADYDEIGDEL